MMENLLANAVRYGLRSGGTRIVVASQPTPGGGLRVTVEDDGPGVPEAYRGRIFDLFQRLDTDGDGTGVGLAVVAALLAGVYPAWVMARTNPALAMRDA